MTVFAFGIVIFAVVFIAVVVSIVVIVVVAAMMDVSDIAGTTEEQSRTGKWRYKR